MISASLIGARIVPQTQYVDLLSEAMPSISSSTQIFANAPASTKEIWLTIRTQGLTMRTDGSAATASANGLDFAVNSTGTPAVFPFNQAAALLCRAIQMSATSTGWITYRG